MNRKSLTLNAPLRNIHFAAQTPKLPSLQKQLPSKENASKSLASSRSRGPTKIGPKNPSLTPVSKTKKNTPHPNFSSVQRKKSPRNETLGRILEKYLEIDEKPSLSPQPKEEKSKILQTKQKDPSLGRGKEIKNSVVRRGNLSSKESFLTVGKGSTEEMRRQLNKSRETRNTFIYRLKLTELSRKYTVYEDWRILASVKYSKDTEGLRGILSPKRWETIKDPRTDSKLLNGIRSPESMRERYKRHLIYMNSEDIKAFDKFVKSHSEEDMKLFALGFTKREVKSPEIWIPPPDSSSNLIPEQSERKNRFSETNKSFFRILPPDLLSKQEESKSANLPKPIPRINPQPKNAPFHSRVLARVEKTFYAKKRPFSPPKEENNKNAKNISQTKEIVHTLKKVKLSSPQPRADRPKDARNIPTVPSKNTSYLKRSDRAFDQMSSREKRVSNQTTASESMESAIALDQNLKNLADLRIDYMILINCKNNTREFIETNKILGADQDIEKELCLLAKTYKTTLGEVVNLVNKQRNPEKGYFRSRY